MADHRANPERQPPKLGGSRALARALAEAGNQKEAREEIQKCLLQEPESADALGVYADILWAARDLPALVEYFQPLIDSLSPDVRLLATIQLAHVEMEKGLYLDAVTRLRRGIEDPAAATASARLVGQVREFLGRCYFRLREIDSARQSLHAAIPILEASGCREGVADALSVLSLVEKCSDRWDRCESLTLQALETYRDISKPFKILAATNNLAVLRSFRGWFESAIDPAQRAVSLSDEVGDTRMKTSARQTLALILIRTGKCDLARGPLATAFRLSAVQPNPRYRALTCEYAGELAFRDGRLDDASRWLARGTKAAAINPDEDVLGEIEARAAEVALARGKSHEALELAERALVRFTRAGDAYEIAVAKRVRGEILISLGRVEEARRDLVDSLDFLNRISERFEFARATELLRRIDARENVLTGPEDTKNEGSDNATRSATPATASGTSLSAA